MASGTDGGLPAATAAGNGSKNQAGLMEMSESSPSRRYSIDIVANFLPPKNAKYTDNFNAGTETKALIGKMLEIDDAKVAIVDKQGKESMSSIDDFPVGLEEFDKWCTHDFKADGGHCVLFKIKSDMLVRDMKRQGLIEYLRAKRIVMEAGGEGATKLRTFAFMGFMHICTDFGTLEKEMEESIANVVSAADESDPIKQHPYFLENKDSHGKIVCPPMRVRKGRNEISLPDESGQVHEHTLEVLMISTDPKAIQWLREVIPVVNERAEENEQGLGEIVPLALKHNSPEIYQTTLGLHGMWAEKCHKVPIWGVPENVMFGERIKAREEGDKGKTVNESLLEKVGKEDNEGKDLPLIRRIERTGDTKRNGMWFIVYNANVAKAVYNLLDNELKQFCEETDQYDPKAYGKEARRMDTTSFGDREKMEAGIQKRLAGFNVTKPTMSAPKNNRNNNRKLYAAAATTPIQRYQYPANAWTQRKPIPGNGNGNAKGMVFGYGTGMPTPNVIPNFYGNHVASSLSTQGKKSESVVMTGHLEKMMKTMAENIVKQTNQQIEKEVNKALGKKKPDSSKEGEKMTTIQEEDEDAAKEKIGMRNFMEATDNRMKKMEATIQRLNEEREKDKIEQQKQDKEFKQEVRDMFQSGVESMLKAFQEETRQENGGKRRERNTTTQQENSTEEQEQVLMSQTEEVVFHENGGDQETRQRNERPQESETKSPRRKKLNNNRTPQRQQQDRLANNSFSALLDMDQHSSDDETLVPDPEVIEQEDGEVVEALTVDSERAKDARRNGKTNRDTGPAGIRSIVTPQDDIEQQDSTEEKEKEKKTQARNSEVVRLSSTETRPVRRISAEMKLQEDEDMMDHNENQREDTTQSDESRNAP